MSVFLSLMSLPQGAIFCSVICNYAMVYPSHTYFFRFGLNKGPEDCATWNDCLLAK